MHAGFQPLRRLLPMNVWRPVLPRALDAGAAADVERIDTIWSECRSRFGAGGPFLYGACGAADAMYVRVVSRFHSLRGRCERGFAEVHGRHLALPAWREWRAAALRETWVLPHDEVDWPESSG